MNAEVKNSNQHTPSETDRKVSLKSEGLAPKFAVGNVIALKSDTFKKGAIVSVGLIGPENRYDVFIDGAIMQYYESQLILIQQETKRRISSLSSFNTFLTALQLSQPGLANLFSLHAARVNYVPYQFKPVIKLIRADRPRMLIADEVGVGKTIEAGLILRELQARRDLRSVLIICPKALVTDRKWQREMKRFDEHFEHLDGKAVRYCINETDKDGAWPGKFAKSIMPFSIFTEEIIFGVKESGVLQKLGLIDLDPLPHFDLVIVDEAHHVRNSETFLHQGIKFFCANAEAVIFLSATPIQLKSDDLFVLLNLLRPDYIIDRASFQFMAEPNPKINEIIALARSAADDWQEKVIPLFDLALSTDWGKKIMAQDPEFTRLSNLVREKKITSDERVRFIRDVEQLHTFSDLINRTRRRDIGNFTTRSPRTISIEFTEQQGAIHDQIIEMQRRIYSIVHDDRTINFIMTTIRRQAASCLHGLAPLLHDLLTRRIVNMESLLSEGEDINPKIEESAIHKLKSDIETLLRAVSTLDPADPKLESLQHLIKQKQDISNNKIILFSSFRHTLKYLEINLIKSKIRIGLMHGDVPDEERQEISRRFRLDRKNNDAIDMLLSSEVGCEGLDYEFCDCMVNYDLPWNPMRVEQRIGRIDRYGQQSEVVAICNLITPGTVDADIYERCLLRIGVFQAALGGSEEILGEITEYMRDIAENLNLSDEQRQRKLQQLADNSIRIIAEQNELEDQQIRLMGLTIPQMQTDAEIKEFASYWLSGDAIQNLVERYIRTLCGDGRDYITGERDLKTLRLDQDARNILLNDFRSLERKPSVFNREWEKWLKGTVPTLRITFDDKAAEENRDVTFVTSVHPLAVSAARAFKKDDKYYICLKCRCDGTNPGDYPFAIYLWMKKGLTQDVELVPICSDLNLRDNLLKILSSDGMVEQSVSLPEQVVFDNLDLIHYELWKSAREDYKLSNTLIVKNKLESLNRSHQARLGILMGQHAGAIDDRIVRMKQSEIERAETDFRRRYKEIKDAENRAEITFQTVAFGVIRNEM